MALGRARCVWDRRGEARTCVGVQACAVSVGVVATGRVVAGGVSSSPGVNVSGGVQGFAVLGWLRRLRPACPLSHTQLKSGGACAWMPLCCARLCPTPAGLPQFVCHVPATHCLTRVCALLPCPHACSCCCLCRACVPCAIRGWGWRGRAEWRGGQGPRRTTLAGPQRPRRQHRRRWWWRKPTSQQQPPAAAAASAWTAATTARDACEGVAAVTCVQRGRCGNLASPGAHVAPAHALQPCSHCLARVCVCVRACLATGPCRATAHARQRCAPFHPSAR
jgi:hypothetical protein